MVQSPDVAEFRESIAESAIACSGIVDVIAPTAELARAIERYVYGLEQKRGISAPARIHARPVMFREKWLSVFRSPHEPGATHRSLPRFDIAPPVPEGSAGLMARKFKTYQTSRVLRTRDCCAIDEGGFGSLGSETNLFHQRFAKETDHPAIVAATFAKPGVVLRRPVDRMARSANMPSCRRSYPSTR